MKTPQPFSTEVLQEMDRMSRNVDTAREAIMADLKKRGKAKDPGVKPSSDPSRFAGGTAHFYTGDGHINCPICNNGELHYSRSAYNGHVGASCTTSGCVNWRE